MKDTLLAILGFYLVSVCSLSIIIEIFMLATGDDPFRLWVLILGAVGIIPSYWLYIHYSRLSLRSTNDADGT